MSRNPNDEKKASAIMAKFYDPNDPNGNVRIGVKKVKVYPLCWSAEQQIALTKDQKHGVKIYNKEQADKINEQLKSVSDKIEKIITSLELSGEVITANKVKDLYDTDMEGLKKIVQKENRSNGFITDFFADYVKGFSNHRSAPCEAFSIFKKYEEATRKHKVREIGFEFMNEYAAWLKGEGYLDNTIYNRIKNFRTFVRNNLSNLAKVDQSYEKLSLNEEVTDKFRLTLEQWNIFFQIKGLPPHLKDAKDTLILMTCFGGVRIGSAVMLDDDSINRLEHKVTYTEMKKEVKQR